MTSHDTIQSFATLIALIYKNIKIQNIQNLTCSPSSPPKSSHNKRCPSSADIFKRSNGKDHKIWDFPEASIPDLASVSVKPFS